jgi:hypothetical protein
MQDNISAVPPVNENQANTVSAPVETPKKSNKTLWIIIVVVVLLLCCICIGVIAASGWITQQSIRDEFQNTIPTPTEELQAIVPTTPDEELPSNLPQAPLGYSWQECPSMQSYFLKPDNWYFLEELKQNYTACYISKEDINNNDLFQTGFTVFMYDNITTEVGGLRASEYAKGIIDSMQKDYNGFEITTIDNGDGIIAYGVYINSDFDGTKVSQYTVAMANDAGDKVYLITYESPTSQWKTSWNNIGGTIIDNLILYVI